MVRESSFLRRVAPCPENAQPGAPPRRDPTPYRPPGPVAASVRRALRSPGSPAFRQFGHTRATFRQRGCKYGNFIYLCSVRIAGDPSPPFCRRAPGHPPDRYLCDGPEQNLCEVASPHSFIEFF